MQGLLQEEYAGDYCKDLGVISLPIFFRNFHLKKEEYFYD